MIIVYFLLARSPHHSPTMPTKTLARNSKRIFIQLWILCVLTTSIKDLTASAFSHSQNCDIFIVLARDPRDFHNFARATGTARENFAALNLSGFRTRMFFQPRRASLTLSDGGEKLSGATKSNHSNSGGLFASTVATAPACSTIIV